MTAAATDGALPESAGNAGASRTDEEHPETTRRARIEGLLLGLAAGDAADRKSVV